MIYKKICRATFISRPNRFIAEVNLCGKTEIVHVKNTGRCKELLIPGATVILSKTDIPTRKTKYDLIAVYKEGFGLVNIDSQAPNKVVREWLMQQKFDILQAEYIYGESRLDFYLKRGNRNILIEVKGCTLEIDGIGYFPDAPTQRGTKHLRELTRAALSGYECYIAFVIQMSGVLKVLPNVMTDPAFAKALDEARNAGVKVLYLQCDVTENEIKISQS